jgi:predicted RNA binding protein YcfA (HicA-like mRNA interferase family)
MPRLVPLKPQEVIRKLRHLGFEGPYPGGRHIRMVDLETGRIVPVPFHKGQDVSVGLIKTIIGELGITNEDWLNL